MKGIERTNKRVVIIGATSGIGMELARKYHTQGDHVGITGRRDDILRQLQKEFGDRCYIMRMDVQKPDSASLLRELTTEMGGMDVMIYCAGIGHNNPDLDSDIEMEGVMTNAEGYTRLAIEAYNYFKRENRKGQIAVLSSIAGVRPLRQAPAYSATKRYEAHYTACLAQKAHKDGVPIKFTTILPGFIRTPMLHTEKYPLEISLDKGARLIFRAIEKRRRQAIVPGRWRIVRILWWTIPKWIWERM